MGARAMESKIASVYYRLELDDYSAAAFTSLGKYYYGTLDEIRDFIAQLSNDDFHDRFSELISAFQAFEFGQHEVTHQVAYRETPLLVPAQLLHKEKITLDNYAWEHLNTWRWPYSMRCEKVESEHFWFACDREYFRATKAVFTNLQYAGAIGQWKDVGNMLWGFPCILAGGPAGFRNLLGEPERRFQSRAEAQKDWAAFIIKPDPDYKEFCNDIFGDG